MLNEAPHCTPAQLESTQEWFAGIITHPLGKNETIQSRTPHGTLIAEEAAQYIIPRPNLPPHLRMQIYNQQYWWRLLNTLHANFPLVTCLFGYHLFNEKIGVPYLLKFPSNHWSINRLGKYLPKWISECYKAPNRSLVLNSSYLDWAFMANLVESQHVVLNLSDIIKENPENLLTTTFHLQPHLTFFKWEYNLFTFRNRCLEESPDYWLKHSFPALPKKKTFHFILYRNAGNNLAWRAISKGEFILLKRFEKGSSMQDACEYIESEESALYQEVEEHLQTWLQNWTQAGLLTLIPREKSELSPD